MATTTQAQSLRIALDGPSALTFFRDCDERGAQPLDATTTLRVLGVDGDAYLSDEDVAATLSEESVFGRLACLEASEITLSTAKGQPKLAPSWMRSFSYCSCTSRDLKRIPYDHLGIQPPSEHFPLFLLVADPQRKRRVRHVHQRPCHHRFPVRSFLCVEGMAYVPSPELIFVLMSHYLTLTGLMLLGMELCGHYRLTNTSSRRPFESREALYGQRPLTSVNRIKRLVDQIDGVGGIKNARRALTYMANGAASPMESVLYLLLCLPRSLGGYGIPAPILNAKRPVTKQAESLTFARHLIPDLYWPASRLDVEYDSEEFHSDPDSLIAGARRTLALRAMRVESISVTYDIVSDMCAFDATARMIVRKLGLRNYKANDDVLRAREALRRALLSHDGVYKAPLGWTG